MLQFWYYYSKLSAPVILPLHLTIHEQS